MARRPAYLLFFVSVFFISSLCAHNTDFVDPFIGTDDSQNGSVWEANGGVYPGPATPFGMVQLTPDKYHYQDKTINGFSFIEHTSGYPHGSWGRFLLMPTTSRHPSLHSTFSHDSEKARPGFYQVTLADSGIKVKTTVTPHCGVMSLQYPLDEIKKLTLWDINEIHTGEAVFSGLSAGHYFWGDFSGRHYEMSQEGDKTIFTLTQRHDKIETVRICFSTSNIAAAKRNFMHEIKGDFADIKKAALHLWRDKLSVVEVEGDSQKDKILFYTSLYHALLDPHLISDVHQAKRYSGLSPWDTFRTKLPLVTLLFPDDQKNFVASVLDRVKQTNTLPVGPMTGSHNIVVFADSLAKGIQFDVEKAYQAAVNSLTGTKPFNGEFRQFLQKGWLPANVPYSVSKTVELAYDYWALSQLAHYLGDSAEQQRYQALALAYRRLMNPKTMRLQAKKRNGEFTEGGFKEGDSQGYTWFVPHDRKGLANIMGGELSLSHELDSIFNQDKIVFDNEPVLQTPYIFNAVGAPWLTQFWSRHILRHNFYTNPKGLPGNDDLGALSSWFVWTALGIFPAVPGTDEYELTAPLFNKIRIQSPSLHTTINAPGAEKKYYIDKVNINAIAYDKTTIKHRELNHADIVMTLSEKPNRDWGHLTSSYSMTKSSSELAIKAVAVDKQAVEPSENITIFITAHNSAATQGLAIVPIVTDNHRHAEARFFVPGHREVTYQVTWRFYYPGRHYLKVADKSPMTITVHHGPAAFVIHEAKDNDLIAIEKNKNALFTIKVKNIGGTYGAKSIHLWVDGKLKQTVSHVLAPGEDKAYDFRVALDKAGHHRLRFDGIPLKDILVYERHRTHKQPPVISLSYQPLLILDYDRSRQSVVDNAPSPHHLTTYGPFMTMTGVTGGTAFQTASKHNRYVEIDNAQDLAQAVCNNEMTMMAWIYPDNEKNFADILTMSDNFVIQVRASNTEVNFYAGGSGAEEAFAHVPANWNHRWHHLAGVREKETVKLYIDGQLVARQKISEPMRQATPGHWAIGRNLANIDRQFNGYISDVRVYALAMPQAEIQQNMLNIKSKK